MRGGNSNRGEKLLQSFEENLTEELNRFGISEAEDPVEEGDRGSLELDRGVVSWGRERGGREREKEKKVPKKDA